MTLLRQDDVVELYQAMLGRRPDSAVRIEKLIARHQSRHSLAAELRRSEEFRKTAEPLLRDAFKQTDGYQAVYCLPALSGQNARVCEDRCAAIEKYIRGPLRCRHLGHLRILDIGCAQGYASLYFSERGATVFGIDAVRNNIDFCKLATQTLHLRATFIQQAFSEETVQFAISHGVNVVFLLSVLHHIVAAKGLDWTRTALTRWLDNKITIIAELAKKDEEVPFAWKSHLPANELDVFGGHDYRVVEIGKFSALNGKAVRPLYCVQQNVLKYGCASEGSPQAQEGDELEILIHESIIFSEVSNAVVSEKQYVMSDDKFAKIFRLGAARDHGRLAQALSIELSIGSQLASMGIAPRVLGVSQNESYFAIIYEKVKGDDLVAFIKKSDAASRRRCAINIASKYAAMRKLGIYWNDCRHHNILIDVNEQPYFIDFELSSFVELEDNLRRFLWTMWHLCHSEHGGLIPEAALPTSELPPVGDDHDGACPEWHNVLELVATPQAAGTSTKPTITILAKGLCHTTDGPSPEDHMPISGLKVGTPEMTQIYISYGITKSASTFAWQLIKRIAIAGGLPIATLTSKSKGADSPEDYIDTVSEKNLILVREDVGDFPVIIKTHGDVTPAVAKLVAEGTAQVFASYRDLRDVALSLLDHGARSRVLGINDFAQFYRLSDTFEDIRIQVERFENWVRVCKPLLLPYDEICFDTRSAISKIAERLGVSVDVDSIFHEFYSNKRSIGQFNKGEGCRFEREMDSKNSAFFIDNFASYYRMYFPDVIKTTNGNTSTDGKAITARNDSQTTMLDPGTNCPRPATVPAGASAPGGSIDELVTAAYRAIFGRSADPSGLHTYGKLFRDVSLSEGIERVVRGLLGSPEYQRKRAAIGEELNSPPKISSLTPEGVQWVSSLGVQVDRVLMVRFSSDSGSRPTIYLQNPSLLTVPRVTQSLTYIDKLISKYLLNSNYYYSHFGHGFNKSDDLVCIFQIKDKPVDAGNTVGYCRAGSKLVLIPDLHFFMSNGYFDLRRELNKFWVPWNDRVQRVFWRGSSTGAEFTTLESLPNLPRFRLCAATVDCTRLRSMLDAKFTDIVQTRNDEAAKIRTHLVSLGLLSTHVPQVDFIKYRFQIDIDGNSNSWGLLPKLMMGSCVLKVMSEWRQWYYEGLRPWEHYVPVKNDLSDLEERIEWCLENDDDARQIGANGTKYANAIVFGPEMTRAAHLVLHAAQNSSDSIF